MNVDIETVVIGVCSFLAIWIAFRIKGQRVERDWATLYQQLALLFTPNTNLEQMNWEEEGLDGESPIPLHSWRELTEWPDSLLSFLKRNGRHIYIIDIETNFSHGYSKLLPGKYLSIPCDAEKLAKKVKASDARLVLCAEGERVMALLKMIHQYAGLRDHLSAVLLIDPVYDKDWIENNFTHEAMDAEASRKIYYLPIQTLKKQSDTLAEKDASLESTYELKTPEIPPSGWDSISVLDLGEISEDLLLTLEWKRRMALYLYLMCT